MRMESLYLFSKDHIWLRREGENVQLGISAYAAEQLGGIVFLNLPEISEQLEVGERFGDIESVKTVSDLISPVSGEVVAVHEEMLDQPEEIGNDPYGNWLVTVHCAAEPQGLMTREEYKNYTEAL